MANNTIKTRIKLCYDTIENWTANNTVLLTGEVGIAYVSADSAVEVMQVNKPALLFKVGDGTTAFNDLPYISAVAADVYTWAKSATKPTYTSSEVGADASGTASQLVNEHNSSSTAHTDIRTLISNLQEKLDSLGNALQFIGAGPIADRPETAENGDVYLATDEGNEYVWSNGAWEQFGAGDALTKAQGDAYYDAKGAAEAVNTQLSETISEVQSSVADNTTSISNIVSGTTVVPKAQNAVSAQTAQTATSAGTATSATNVTSQIAGHPISNIFENDGVTVKNATSAQSATEDSEGNVISTTYATQSSLESVSETADNALSVANSKYTKPSDGIPETDLSQAVQQKLNNPVVDITPNPSGEATQQLSTIEINGVVYEVSPNMIVDLGDVGDMAEHIDISVTSQQLAQLLDAKTCFVKIATTGGAIFYLVRTMEVEEAGGTVIYEYTTYQGTTLARYQIVVQANISTQVSFNVEGVSIPESIVVDLGNVGNLSSSPMTLNISAAQGQALLSNTSVIAKLCVEGDAYLYLTSTGKNGDGGGNAQYASYIVGEDSNPYIITYGLAIRNSALTQPEFSFQRIDLSAPSTSIVDLGNVGELAESPTTITITPEQCTQLLAADTSIVRFTTGDIIMNLLRMMKHGDGGGTAFYTATMLQGGYISSHILIVHNSTPTQAQIGWEDAELGGTTVVANPTAAATSALSKLQVGNTVYSVGTPVIDLGEVTLTEQSLGGISMATADNITVSAEQATLAQADNPPIVKIRFDNDDHEFCRTKIATDASAAYIYFAATEDMGERTRFYNLQITVPLTGGTASAMLLVWAYDILQGLNYAYEARGLTFVDGVATKTITEEERGAFNEGAYNQIRFWDNSNTNETYALYLSHSNRGASSINSHKCDYFGIVENASVTGEGGGLTAYAAYLDGTTLTIKQVAIGSGSGTSVPTPTTADAGKYVVVNPDGTSYILATPNAANAQVISEEAYAELLASGQVDANTVYLIEGTSDNKLTLTAATTSYDNASSGLTATNVQGAIDELQENKQNLLTLQSLATLLGLTEAQLNNLITFSKSITSTTTGSTTISGTITADTFNTAQ